MSDDLPAMPYLRVNKLSVQFHVEDGVVHAVDTVSFAVAPGRTLGIVGESGSGKSVTGLAIMGLLDPAHATVSGEILVGGRSAIGMPEEGIRKLRGREIAMIFQDPLSALHPSYPVGRQVVEAYRVHHPAATRSQARRRAIEMLGRVGIPRPDQRVDQYPHEFSGGMRQRVMIAIALVNDPRLLIADEPTTALDVTVQAQILDLLVDLQRESNSAIVLITHDFGVVGQVSDDVLVMYAGRIVESGSVSQVLRRPQHPYTSGLLSSVPSLHDPFDSDLVPIGGNPPNSINLPTGCAFHPRCGYADHTGGLSRSEVPTLLPTSEPGHLVACHLPEVDRRRIHDARMVPSGPDSR